MISLDVDHQADIGDQGRTDDLRTRQTPFLVNHGYSRSLRKVRSGDESGSKSSAHQLEKVVKSLIRTGQKRSVSSSFSSTIASMRCLPGSGVVTSGIPSPTLGTNIAMGYVASGNHKKGTKLMIEVRRKMREAVIRPMPFIPTRYYK